MSTLVRLERNGERHRRIVLAELFMTLKELGLARYGFVTNGSDCWGDVLNIIEADLDG